MSSPSSFEAKHSLLYAEDVRKTYDGRKFVLADIDLQIESGEIVSLVGPSGCGKSTLLKMILGQTDITDGTFLMQGEPIGRPDLKRGIVYQEYSLFPNLTVIANVRRGLELQVGIIEARLRRKEFNREAMYYLDQVGLGKHANKFPHELSGGMRQRVAIAQSLIVHPLVLLMDEAFGALDEGTREDMQVFMLELWEKAKARGEDLTIVFVTHSLTEAAYIGTRLIGLSQYYTSNTGTGIDEGARIVFDELLPEGASSTDVKNDPEFARVIERVKQECFERDHLQHVSEFNLNHPNSFITT